MELAAVHHAHRRQRRLAGGHSRHRRHFGVHDAQERRRFAARQVHHRGRRLRVGRPGGTQRLGRHRRAAEGRNPLLLAQPRAVRRAALDGSAIETNAQGELAYYGALPTQVPQRIPESATRLRQDLDQMSPTVVPRKTSEMPCRRRPRPRWPPPRRCRRSIICRRCGRSLNKHATQLYGIVDEQWRRFLGMPSDVFNVNEPPNSDAVQASLRQFDRIAGDPKYKSLADRPEFQSTHELMKEYARELTTGAGQVALPPPPEASGERLQATDQRLTGYRLQATDHRLQVGGENAGPQASGLKSRASFNNSGERLQATDHRLQVEGKTQVLKPQASSLGPHSIIAERGYRLQTTGYR